MTANPSDPSVSITGPKFVITLPKNGAAGPNNIDTNTESATISARSLVASHNQPFIFSNRSTHQIALALSKDETQITTEDPEKASSAKENIDGKYSGEDLIIGYNAAYLKDILAHIPSDEVVVKLNSSISAALFYPKKQEGNTELTTLLMPIRLNE